MFDFTNDIIGAILDSIQILEEKRTEEDFKKNGQRATKDSAKKHY